MLTGKPNTVLTGIVALLAGAFLILSVTQAIRNPDSMMSVSAARSLITGEARAFHDEYLIRLGILRDPEIRDAKLPAFTAPPHVLFFELGEVSVDSNYWINTSMATFYEKDSVVLQTPAYFETLEAYPLY